MLKYGPPIGSCEVDIFPVSLRQDIHPVVTLLGASKMSGITKEFSKAAILGMEI